jgi:nucleotide-binding universal stress UspA family protein
MDQQEKPRILFPYDFSAESDYAMQYLISLTKVFNYSIEILNILDPGTRKFMKENKLSKSGLTERVKQLTEEFQTKYDIPATYLIKNVPIKRIRKISEREKVSFTFLAMNEPQKMASRIMKVVTTSPVPAFVVQNGVDFKPFRNIIFPLDDSFASRQKAGWALRFAKKTNATLHVFSVNPASLTSKEKERKQFKVIDTVEQFFAKNGVGFVSEISQGNYRDFDNDVLKYAEKVSADLYIIMIPTKIFRSISQLDFKLIFNSGKIPIFCVNQRNLFLGGGIS